MRMSIILSLLLFASPLSAQEDLARLEMVDGWQTDTGTRIVAMHIALRPGWKTYWRSPGDSGVPPQIDWRGSRNLAGAEIIWPTPVVYDDAGLRTIGYKDELILPLELTAKREGRPIRAAGVLSIGVCEEICVPVDLPFRLETVGPGGKVPAIVAAIGARPRVVESTDLPAISCSVDPIDDGLRLTARLQLASQGGREAAVFEHQDADLWVSAADLSREGAMIEVAADLVPPEAQPFALDRSGLRLTVIGKDGAIEIRGCPAG